MEFMDRNIDCSYGFVEFNSNSIYSIYLHVDYYIKYFH